MFQDILRSITGKALCVFTLLLLSTMCGCLEDHDVNEGNSGHSFMLGDQFVIVQNGFRLGRVTWVAVVNFRKESTSEERHNDPRVILDPHGVYLVRREDGRTFAPAGSEPRLYFFDGDKLVTFPIEMTEDELGGVESGATSYRDLLERFHKFEMHGTAAR